MVNEEWKNLDFINCSNYEVSNLGRIRNIKTGKLLKGFLNRKVRPYRQVLLTDDEKNSKAPRVCRLVAILFVNNPEPDVKQFVDHIDGDTLNDVATNLRWVTRTENMANPVTRERLKESHIGISHPAWNKGIKTGPWNKPMSDEGKKNISEGVKQYWRNKKLNNNVKIL